MVFMGPGVVNCFRLAFEMLSLDSGILLNLDHEEI